MLGRVLLIALFTVVAGSAALAQMSDAEFTKFIQARADKFGDAVNKHDAARVVLPHHFRAR